MFIYKKPSDLTSVNPSVEDREPFKQQEKISDYYLVSRFSTIDRLKRDCSGYIHDIVLFRDCNLEKGPDCLPQPLREVFYHLSYKYNTFLNKKIHPSSDLLVLMNHFDKMALLEESKFSNDLCIDLARILGALIDNEKLNYFIVTIFGNVPWNDSILPILSMPLDHDASVRYTNTLTRHQKSNSSYPIKSIESIMSKSKLIETIDHYIKGVSTDRLETPTMERFVKGTRCVAPALNGTACVGKSTLLRLIEQRANTSCNVIKISQYGGFHNKDQNDLIGMQCLPVMVHACEQNYNSVADRCIFNNIIWKLIMSLMNVSSDMDMARCAFEILHSLNLNLIEFMKRFPVFVLVDSAVSVNRKRMFSRGINTLERENKFTGDLYRCKIIPYVKAQNVIYGTLATICDWPVLDVGGKFPLCDKWIDMVTGTFCEKLKWNNEHHAHDDSEEIEYGKRALTYKHSEYPPLDYTAAKCMKIYK